MREQLRLFGLGFVVLLSTSLTVGQGDNNADEVAAEVADVVEDAVAVVDAVVGDNSPNQGGSLAKSWDGVRPFVIKYGVPAIIDAEAGGASTPERDLFEARQAGQQVSKRRGWWRRTWQNIKPFIPTIAKVLLSKKRKNVESFRELQRHIKDDPEFWERQYDQSEKFDLKDIADVEKADGAPES